MQPNWKPSATLRKIKARKVRLDAKSSENDNKKEARKRDGHRCRFPRCGCRLLQLRLEVSHQQHKGAGGDITGKRSPVSGLITFCVHRHQHGPVSIHKGTLRARPLTPAGTNGQVAFEVDLSVILNHLDAPRWFEVARETAVQQLAPLTDRQQRILARLAEMTL